MTPAFFTKQLAILFAIVGIFLTGCAGPKVATDLLEQIPPVAEPTVDHSVEINTSIEPTINNYEGLDVTLRESLKMALTEANIFNLNNAQSAYSIQAHIDIASQAAMSFGNFEGTLQVTYQVFDESEQLILEKTIHTVAGSDAFYFSGAKRHRRARAVNMAKNVTEFTDFLKEQFR